MVNVFNHIILARHGQTVSNRDRFIMGQADSPLTEHGLLVAAQVALRVKRHGVDAVYSSPLGRAVASANVYTQDLGIPIVLTDAMAELSFGVWEGKSQAEVRPTGGRLRMSWDDRPPGGESYRDAEPRVQSFLPELRERARTDRVLVVGHAGVNRVFLKLWLGLEPARALWIGFPHEALVILGEAKQVRTILATGESTEGLLIKGE
jgi:broad specificity phosphatase PhoE